MSAFHAALEPLAPFSSRDPDETAVVEKSEPLIAISLNGALANAMRSSPLAFLYIFSKEIELI